MKGILAILFVSFAFSLAAQTDSTYIHNRKKAAMLSLALPGAGQIYNEFGHRKVQGRKNISWWRAPLFVGGLAYTAFLAYTSADSASIYKEEWLFRDANGENNFLYPSLSGLDKFGLQTEFDRTARRRDYAIAGFALIYALNVADAFIDAHFVTWDVSNDLSLNLKPRYFGRSEFGATLALSFK